MTATTEELTKRARFLRNAAPQQFNDFIAEFSDYMNQNFKDLVDATDNFQNAQGHAQQCKAIFNALERAKNG